MDVVHRRALAADRGRLLSDLADWLARALGHAPLDLALYERALTHSSQSTTDYERLEFLGDRVLGLTVAEWLFELFPQEPEGHLSKRLNTLVTGAVCAEVARGIGVPVRVRLGKQARDDGAAASDNVLGDVMEALIGAVYLEARLDGARALVRRLWRDRIDSDAAAPQHPKSALQEWAAATRRRAPAYEILDRAGPGHAPRFTVRATVGKLDAIAEGGSKQEAETAAAAALLEKVR